ncbi:MAG: DUF983 domain-containing protein [Alphaproteobacteria bacterium]|nr:DUF983 domain-containing protein [Alphaproteobacteria bacterium]
MSRPRPLWTALRRGFARRCPACGQGRLLHRVLKVVEHCARCGEAMHHHRADDAPPYFTILILGHVVLPGMLLLEQTQRPAEWVHLAIWLPLSLAGIGWLLPRVKGALIGLQWAQGMHGFGAVGKRPRLDSRS